MKKEMIIATIVLAVLVSISGIASASPENIVVTPSDQPLVSGQSPPGGAFSTYSIAVTGIVPKSVGNLHTIMATTTLILSGGGGLGDLRYNFHYGASSSGWITSGSTFSWTDTGGTSDSLTVDVMDTGTAVDTKYQFKIDDSYPIGSGSDTAQSTVYGTVPIPEQNTLVLTSAGLLGLIGLMASRKYKK